MDDTTADTVRSHTSVEPFRAYVPKAYRTISTIGLFAGLTNCQRSAVIFSKDT